MQHVARKCGSLCFTRAVWITPRALSIVRHHSFRARAHGFRAYCTNVAQPAQTQTEPKPAPTINYPWSNQETIPKDYWEDRAHRKEYMEWLIRKLNPKYMDDWYDVSEAKFADLGGAGLVKKFGNTMGIVAEHFPDHKWLPWIFVNPPAGMWDSFDTRKAYLDWVGTRLGYKAIYHYYHITVAQITHHKGASILALYNNQPSEMIPQLYKDHTWNLWQFSSIPAPYWDDKNHHKIYLEWLGKKLEYKTMEDWYQVTLKDFLTNSGLVFLTKYQNQLVHALIANYPEHTWLPWLFPVPPLRYWRERDNQMRYLTWLVGKMGFKHMEDFYTITMKDLEKFNGLSLVQKYDNSPSRLVMALYPAHTWEPWRFPTTPYGYWDEIEHVQKYMEWLGKRLGYKEMSDWYNVSTADFKSNNGFTLLQKYELIHKLVAATFPKHEWDAWKFTRTSSNVDVSNPYQKQL